MNLARTNPHLLDTRNLLVIGSPILILVIGNLAARLSVLLLGDWAWVGTIAVYWGSIAFVITMLGRRARLSTWFAPSRGGLLWPVVAVLAGLCPLPLLLLPNVHLFNSPLLTALWLLFGLVNPLFEELYWRGFLLNEIRGLPQWLTVLYSGALFTVIHPLMLGVFAKSMANLSFIVILIGLALVYSLVYLRTRSLRWPIVSHVLTDLSNMSIFVFMNLIALPQG